MTPKPAWWPENPYPEDIFPMAHARYAEIVPDDDQRTALSGMLGRMFWQIASDAIWRAMQDAEHIAADAIREAMEDAEREGKVP